MQNLTNEELQALLDKANAELAAAKAETKAANPLKVSGIFECDITIEGKKVKKKYGVADGAIKMWNADSTALLPTEKVVKLANGTALSNDEISASPTLAELVDPVTNKDNGKAKALLTDAAQRGAALLVEIV